MEPITLRDFRNPKVKVFTKEQALADEIWRGFGKELRFPLLMALVKRWGVEVVYSVFNDVRQSDARDKARLFLWRFRQ